jgi:hypothetical protein
LRFSRRAPTEAGLRAVPPGWCPGSRRIQVARKRDSPGRRGPSSPAQRPDDLWVRVLRLGEHAGPMGHVGEVPARGESGRVPRMPPDVAKPVPRASRETSACVLLPGDLRPGVVVQPNGSALPVRPVALSEPRVVPLAVTGEAREVGRPCPDGGRLDEERVLEDRANEGNPTLPEVAFERLNGIGKGFLVQADVGHSTAERTRSAACPGLASAVGTLGAPTADGAPSTGKTSGRATRAVIITSLSISTTFGGTVAEPAGRRGVLAGAAEGEK